MEKPKIRFKGYQEDWEQRKLGELGEISTGSTPSTSNSAYYSEDGIPWVTPTDINELTISDTPRKLSEEGAKVGRVVPANTILCTCIASIGKNTLLTVKGSFNQQINSLTPYDENDAYFLLTDSEIWSNTMKRMAASGTMQIVNKTEFSELKTMVPSLVEQQAIGTYFHNLDHLITLHQRKCEETKILKKYMLQKMFPQNGHSVPEIRFSGFTEDWEQRKLNEIADKVSEKNKNNEFSEPFTNSAEQGIISQKDYFDREIVNNENLNGYYIVRNDDFIYNPRISVTAPVGPINRNRLGRNGVMSPLYTVFRAHDIDNLYLEFYFKTTKWHRFMKLNGDSGARFDRFTISSTQFMEMPIPYPTLEEQQKIGEYFDSLDLLITLHQQKCDELRNIKKFMLQNMFI
ncbi:restriction endonuclease subunit S [Oliverpabstia intestinalis]|uniref:restriction endonuclease subunit S n=1 Tax=Oliverpabstia intestinalis TaxID=2606633 RepID=UPI003F89E5D0